MTSTTPARKPPRVPGARLLITASALAAMLAGWASLAWKAAADSVGAASALSAQAQLEAAGIVLQPIPTLVTSPTQRRVTNLAAWPQGGSQPVLRSVHAPPAPVTRTQSSRP